MVKIDKYEVPDQLYDAYVAWYATHENFPDAWMKTTKEMMKLHEKICKTLGIYRTEDENDPFYHAFMQRVRHDAGVHDIDIVNKYVAPVLFKPPEEEDMDKLQELFNEIKRLALVRDDTLKKFLELWEFVFGEELGELDDASSGIDWTNVLLLGHEDGSFHEFLIDHGKAKLKMGVE